MEPHSGTPIVVLRGITEEIVIPIWVGSFEANAIALEIEKAVPQRPLTHDLLKNVVTQFGAFVERVVITDLRNDTFFALIEMRDKHGDLMIIDSRPSDAIALALRFSCGIWVKREVVRLAGTNIENQEQDSESSSSEDVSVEEWPDVISE